MLESTHVFFTSLSYLPYAFIVYVFLLYVPALAIFPKLTQKPAYFIAAPIISLLINAFIAAVFFKLQLYTPILIPVIFTLTALLRWVGFSQWQKNDYYIVLINSMAVIPLFVMCGLSAFMDSDALVSWNTWAQYYYHGNTPPVFLSEGGYPPLFPLIFSYIYKFLGTADYQGVAKTVLVIFPFTVLNCIAFAGKIGQKAWLVFVGYIAIACISVFAETGYRFYSIGFADPLLAATLTLAIFLLIFYTEEKKEDTQINNDFVLMLATLATIAASLSKQPGFLWALFSFPLILTVKMLKEKHVNWREIFAIVAAVIPVLMWVLGPGRHFASNVGVIHASTGSNVLQIKNLFSTLGSSIIKYWVESPGILLLYGWAIFSMRKNLTLILVFVSFILPGTVLWFMLGAYDVRLGLQLLSACALLIAYNDFYPLNKVMTRLSLNFRRAWPIFFIAAIVSFLFFSLKENVVQHGFVRGHLYPLNGPKTIVYHYFDQDGSYVYTLIYEHPEKKLWIANWFIAPLFANNNTIFSPPPETEATQKIYDSIVSTQPDYVFMNDPGQFPAENTLKKIVQKCPFLFKPLKLTQKQEPFNYRIFEFDDTREARLNCERRLHE
jgi:hypothetical protein